MKNFIVSVQREYWEYRRVVLGLPIILSVLVVLASFMATMSHRYNGSSAHTAQHQLEAGQKHSACFAGDSETSQDSAFDLDNYLAEVEAETPSRFIALYIGLAWLIGLYYLLSSLYQDRKDNSILYWKSLPVSETQNVLIKLFFGVFCFAAVSVLIAWLVYSLLWLFGLGLVACTNGGDEWRYIDRSFDFGRLFLAPFALLICGLLWGAPVFAYVLMVSAIARRRPFLLLLLPLPLLAIVERIVFGSSHIGQFAIDHMPFSVVHPGLHGAGAAEVWQTFMIDSLPGLLLGLVFAALFLAVAVYYRNHRFEQ